MKAVTSEQLSDLVELYVELVWRYGDEATKSEVSVLSEFGEGRLIDEF